MLNSNLSNTNGIQVLSTFLMIGVLAALFIVLLYIIRSYYKYYSKCVENKLEDQEIKKQLIAENKSFFEKTEQFVNSSSISREQKMSTNCYFVPYFNNKQGKLKRKQRNSLIKSVVFYAIFAIIFVVIIWAQIMAQTIYIGKKTGVVVLTGSMGSAYAGNEYLVENNLTNRIKAGSFITLEKVEKDSDVKLYDIVAYKDPDGNLIIHRIIRISELDGRPIYECRGDANSSSKLYERVLRVEDFIGKYTGRQNYVLGVALNFLKSGFGIIAIIAVFVVLFLYDEFEKKSDGALDSRKPEVAEQIDYEIKYAIYYEKPLELLKCLEKQVVKKSKKTNIASKNSEISSLDNVEKKENHPNNQELQEEVEEIEEVKETQENVEKVE